MKYIMPLVYIFTLLVVGALSSQLMTVEGVRAGVVDKGYLMAIAGLQEATIAGFCLLALLTSKCGERWVIITSTVAFCIAVSVAGAVYRLHYLSAALLVGGCVSYLLEKQSAKWRGQAKRGQAEKR